MATDFLTHMKNTKITIREVGLREGLQSHQAVLATADKARLFRGLVAAGCREINACAFVNPNRMPQMADAEDLLRAIAPDAQGVDVSCTVLNERGMERAVRMRQEGLMQTALFVFSTNQAGMRANGIMADTEELFDQIARCAVRCVPEDMRSVVFISGAFGDNEEGRVDPEMIYVWAKRLYDLPGISEILISDSTGQADPLQIYNFFRGLADVLPRDKRIGLHMHDTRGAGLANIAFALASPFEHFVLDSSFGGWGGDYPFVDDSFGNVPTEDLAEMLSGMGFETGIDVEAMLKVTRDYSNLVGRGIGSKLHFSSGPLHWKRAQSRTGAPA
jgi:isopropylmalate/homocitrate/citramalate synthase